MLSAEGVCCKKLPNITSELSIKANSLDPEQTVPIRSSLIWVHTVYHRGHLNIQQTRKAATFVAIGTLRVNKESVWSHVLVRYYQFV